MRKNPREEPDSQMEPVLSGWLAGSWELTMRAECNQNNNRRTFPRMFLLMFREQASYKKEKSSEQPETVNLIEPQRSENVLLTEIY